jgi:hypothetical protein
MEWIEPVSRSSSPAYYFSPRHKRVLRTPSLKLKTCTSIVSGPPGGGFDTYARMIARTMPKHIPGNPTIIVDNMPGAKTMEDPEFLGDANKAKLGVAPVSGDELERRVNGFFKLPEDLKRKLKRVLYD